MRASLQWPLTLFFALIVSVCQAQDKPAPEKTSQEKVTLLNKAQAGQVARYRSEYTLNVEFSGMKGVFEAKETNKVTFTEAAPNGNITLEQETESAEVTFNGQKLPDDENKDKTTIVLRPDGTLVSYKSTAKEPEQAKLGARHYPMTTPVFIAKPIGPGDKWSHVYKGDDSLGTRNARAEFEVIGFEKAVGVDTVKIRMTYAEEGGMRNASARGLMNIETATGDVVKGEFEVENLPLPQGMVANGKINSERIEGAPIKGITTQPGKPEPKKEKTIDEVVKEYEKLPGVFTLYRKKEPGRLTIYMEIKEEQLNQNHLLQATAATGTSQQIVAGEPINDLLIRFIQIEDDRVQLIVPNVNFRAAEGTPIARSVRRSFADAILEQYKIEAKQPDRKSLLINVSDLFRGDIAQISQYFASQGGLLGGGGGYALDREKTYVSAIKNFPENLVVETQYNFMRPGGGGGGLAALLSGNALADPRSAPIKVIYNLFPLKETGYKPRLYDPRVGYFTVEYQDLTSDNKEDQRVQYILRWHLEKSDPKAALSPPKKPIVFWLDNAIPLEYRDAVRDGILFWNKAFEKIGFKDAVVVKQMPDDADWDTADMRYNVIRWVTSPNDAYAVAHFRANPITGEIVNASITVDAGIVKYTKMEKRLLVDPASYFQEDDPAQIKKRLETQKLRMKSLSACAACDMASQKMEQAWFGWTALRLLGGGDMNDKEYACAFIRDVVSHEMGHIMGLRHNFIASTLHTLEDLKNGPLVKRTGVSASVMDYNSFNISALKQKGVDFFMSTVGPYDIWAIEYGYLPIDAQTPQGEVHKLSQIASRGNMTGLAYQSDEVADQFDPAVTRWDMGRHPLDYWVKNAQVSRYLLLNLGERLPKPGESYWEFTRDFQRLVGTYARSAAVASRYVGGLHVNRNFKGDPGEKPTLAPVSQEDQLKALRMLNTYVFAENAFQFPRKYYYQMTDNPNANFVESFMATKDFPIRDTFASIQRAALQRIYRPDVLQRIVNNEFKIGDESKALTLPTLFRSTGANIWSELEGRRNIGTLRRQLQREHIDLMAGMVLNPSGSAPADAKMLAWDQMTRLKSRLEAARRSNNYDSYTRVHLDESLMRIERVLDAEQTIGSGGGGRPITLQDLLGGQQR